MSEGPELSNPFAPPAPSITDNPHFRPKTISRRRQQYLDTVYSLNKNISQQIEAREQQIQHSKNFTGVRVLFCSLCSGKLVKSKKSTYSESLHINIPTYKCEICKSKYSGFVPFVRHESKSDLLAEIIEYPEK